jgi:YfiH family protein
MHSPVVIPDILKAHAADAFFTTKAFEDNRLHEYISGVESIYLPVQQHTDKVIIVEYDLEPKIADAVITNRPGLAIAVKTADCVPVLVYDPVRRVAGAVHAGWRGTAQSILKRTIEAFSERFGSSPGDIIVAIGPSIRSCCYEVGPEVVKGVQEATGSGDYVSEAKGKHRIDLQAANRIQALSKGIHSGNIQIIEECTHCMPEKYYSYRYSKGTTGRQFAVISIRK